MKPNRDFLKQLWNSDVFSNFNLSSATSFFLKNLQRLNRCNQFLALRDWEYFPSRELLNLSLTVFLPEGNYYLIEPISTYYYPQIPKYPAERGNMRFLRYHKKFNFEKTSIFHVNEVQGGELGSLSMKFYDSLIKKDNFWFQT